MRPVRLTIQAFGPYPKRETIDFRDAVDAGIFGIYGQTGAGKSTVFSAMTFALFGESAKSEQEAPSLRSDHADPDDPTEVEFVFDVGEQRFVVLRRPDQMRPKRRGDGETRSAHEAYLFNATDISPDEITETRRGKIIAEKKVREVDAAIAAMLGYGSEQFRQIVLLPQGRFETFLAAKTKERLEILRDLFDVSLYQMLMADLKVEAEAAERHVREERELCARQLSSEGFESSDALNVEIEGVKTLCKQIREEENNARVASETARKKLKNAEAIEEKFTAANDASENLAKIQADQADMNALAEHVARTEQARSLLDVEGHVDQASREIDRAKAIRHKAKRLAKRKRKMAKSAAKELKKQADRTGEMDELRRKVEDLGRLAGILGRATGIASKAEQAEAAERKAVEDFDDAKRALEELKDSRSAKGKDLKAARSSETRRKEIADRIATLKTSLATAKTYEAAARNFRCARTDVDKQKSKAEVALRRADNARSGLDQAESNLSAVQALHLATKLEAGSPCPVCGSTEHPAPATGAIENAGLDQVFREARTAWESADKASREAAEALAGMRSILAERKDRLGALDHPDGASDNLTERIRAEQRALKDLGPKTDLEAAEAEMEQLEKNIEFEEGRCDKLREVNAKRRRETATIRSRLDEALATVPEHMRDPDTLATAREAESQALRKLIAAKTKAEEAERSTREAALAAKKDRKAAERALSVSRDRRCRANDSFRTRLDQTGLSEKEFRDLKPAIEDLDTHRETVEEFRRKLHSARDMEAAAATAIEGLSRPDIRLLDKFREEAETKQIETTERRVEATNRSDRLAQLRDDLAETLRRLDEDEKASGHLREVAALVNGNNPQRLNLETFAIGAMFDRILAAANQRLGPMTANRYRLERDLDGSGRGSRGLGIQVFDMYTGKSRPTTTLSGGETFIAAFALALGLADVVESASGKVRLDTIFIDEGFGSLDTENGSGTLEQILQVLNDLVRKTRSVGLISHVPLVQEAIPNGFYIRKDLAGSKVETRGLN